MHAARRNMASDRIHSTAIRQRSSGSARSLQKGGVCRASLSDAFIKVICHSTFFVSGGGVKGGGGGLGGVMTHSRCHRLHWLIMTKRRRGGSRAVMDGWSGEEKSKQLNC